MINEVLTGTITDVSPNGITIHTELPRGLLRRQYEKVNVEFLDARSITPDQRKKAWALMGEIAEWSGDIKEDVYTTLRYDFSQKQVEGLQMKLFRLSRATVTEARAFIDYLITFCLDFDVPTKYPLVEYCDDIEKYMWACLRHKRCAVCGKKADLHHVDRIGMGGNRETMDHTGYRVMPLCRLHHKECHNMAQEEFNERYHLIGIPADQEIIKLYKLGRRQKK